MERYFCESRKSQNIGKTRYWTQSELDALKIFNIMELLTEKIKCNMKIKLMAVMFLLMYANIGQSQFLQMTTYKSEYFNPSSLKIHQYQDNTFFIYQNLDNNISIYQFKNDSLNFKFTIENSCSTLNSFGMYKNNFVIYGNEGFNVFNIFDGAILRTFEEPIFGVINFEEGFIKGSSLNDKRFIDIENLQDFKDEQFVTQSENFYYRFKVINDTLHLVKTNKIDRETEILTKLAFSSASTYKRNKNTYLFRKEDKTLVFLDTKTDSIFFGSIFEDIVQNFNIYNDSNFIVIGGNQQKKSISIINKNNGKINTVLSDLPRAVYNVIESKGDQIVFRDPLYLYVYDTLAKNTKSYFVSSDFSVLLDSLYFSYYNPKSYTYLNIKTGKQYSSKTVRLNGEYSSDFSSITFIHDHKYYSILKDENNGNRINQIDVGNNQEIPISSDDLVENYGLGNYIDYNQNELYFSDFNTSMKPNIYSKESNDGIIDFEPGLPVLSNYVKIKNTIYYIVKSSVIHQDTTKIFVDLMSYDLVSKNENVEVLNLEIKSNRNPILNLIGDLLRVYTNNVHESTYIGSWNILSDKWILRNNVSGPFLNNIIFSSNDYIYCRESKSSGTKIFKYKRADLSEAKLIYESMDQFVTVDFIRDDHFVILDNDILNLYNHGQIKSLKVLNSNAAISIKKLDYCSKLLVKTNDNSTFLIDLQSIEVQEFAEQLDFSARLFCENEKLIYVDHARVLVISLNDPDEINRYLINDFDFLGYYISELHFYDYLNLKILVLDTLLNVIDLEESNFRSFGTVNLNVDKIDSPKVLLSKEDELNFSNNLNYLTLYYPELRSFEKVLKCDDNLSVYNDNQNKGYILKDSMLYFIGASLDNGLQLYQYIIPEYEILSKTNSYKDSKNIFLYPNPTLDQINFSVEADKVELFNVSGNILVSKESISNIDVSALIEGLYIVLIYKGSNIYTKKFVKI
jgi:hypothetical protein